jgi:hypothetical protein
MVIDRAGVLLNTNILNGHQKVNEFTYLGSILQTYYGSSREIRRHVTLWREAVSRQIPFWTFLTFLLTVSYDCLRHLPSQ